MHTTQFVKHTSPYVRKDTSTKRMMIDVLIALTPVVFFSIYRFGMNAVFRILISVLTFVLVEAIWYNFTKKGEGETWTERLSHKYSKYSVNYITAPAVSGVIYSMLVPNNLNLYVVFMGALFGIVFGKLIFGGLGHNIFNPAALGRVLIALTFTSFFTGSYGFVDAAAGATPLAIEFPNIFNFYTINDLIFGNIPGSMGEINSIAILIGAAYLFIRKSADYRPVLSAALIFTALITIAGFILHPGYVMEYVVYHIFTGGLLFGLVYMVTDPVTSPVTRPGRWLYGLIIGTLVFMIRIFGNLPEGVAFALLISNIFVPLLDYPKWAKNNYGWKFATAYATVFILIATLAGLIVGGYLI